MPPLPASACQIQSLSFSAAVQDLLFNDGEEDKEEIEYECSLEWFHSLPLVVVQVGPLFLPGPGLPRGLLRALACQAC
jgi:hypothetical protein